MTPCCNRGAHLSGRDVFFFLKIKRNCEKREREGGEGGTSTRKAHTLVFSGSATPLFFSNGLFARFLPLGLNPPLPGGGGRVRHNSGTLFVLHTPLHNQKRQAAGHHSRPPFPDGRRSTLARREERKRERERERERDERQREKTRFGASAGPLSLGGTPWLGQIHRRRGTPGLRDQPERDAALLNRRPVRPKEGLQPPVRVHREARGGQAPRPHARGRDPRGERSRTPPAGPRGPQHLPVLRGARALPPPGRGKGLRTAAPADQAFGGMFTLPPLAGGGALRLLLPAQAPLLLQRRQPAPRAAGNAEGDDGGLRSFPARRRAVVLLRAAARRLWPRVPGRDPFGSSVTQHAVARAARAAGPLAGVGAGVARLPGAVRAPGHLPRGVGGPGALGGAGAALGGSDPLLPALLALPPPRRPGVGLERVGGLEGPLPFPLLARPPQGVGGTAVVGGRRRAGARGPRIAGGDLAFLFAGGPRLPLLAPVFPLFQGARQGPLWQERGLPPPVAPLVRAGRAPACLLGSVPAGPRAPGTQRDGALCPGQGGGRAARPDQVFARQLQGWAEGRRGRGRPPGNQERFEEGRSPPLQHGMPRQRADGDRARAPLLGRQGQDDLLRPRRCFWPRPSGACSLSGGSRRRAAERGGVQSRFPQPPVR